MPEVIEDFENVSDEKNTSDEIDIIEPKIGSASKSE